MTISTSALSTTSSTDAETPVDVQPQYGVANMYVLALVFKLIPLGYGAFELFNGALWATWLFGVYAILRAARVPRALGVLAVVLVMLSSMFSEIANWVSIVGYPSTAAAGPTSSS